MHDLVIRNVLLCDGLGTALRPGALAVTAGRIAAMGDDPGPGRQTIDGGGLVLAPGIVDIHTHYDAQLIWDRIATPSPGLGVTTVVIGNCGFTIAPCRPADRDLTLRNLTKVEGMPLAALQAGIGWDFESFGDYVAALERRGVVPNIACFAGHSAIRTYVMGEAATRRAATPAEVEAMQEILREALRDGAIGFATSTFESHNGDGGVAIASRWAAPDELAGLAAVLGEAGSGVFQITRGAGTSLDFLEEIAVASGRPVHIGPLLVDPADPAEVTAVMRRLGAARARAGELYGQASPFPEVMDFSLVEPYPFENLVAWQSAMAAEDRAALAQVYGERGFRDAVKAELATRGVPLRFSNQWNKMVVTEGADPAELGRDVASLARAAGRHPLDRMLDIGLENGLATRFKVVMFNDEEARVRALMADPCGIIGLGDAGAHLSFFCQAGTGLYLLRRFVRERRDFTLEEAIRLLTSRPADAFRIPDRGRLVPGAHADLMLFDPERVDIAPPELVHDLPGGLARIDTPPIGLHGVWVNGSRVADENGLLPDPPAAGTVLRRFAR